MQHTELTKLSRRGYFKDAKFEMSLLGCMSWGAFFLPGFVPPFLLVAYSFSVFRGFGFEARVKFVEQSLGMCLEPCIEAVAAAGFDCQGDAACTAA